MRVGELTGRVGPRLLLAATDEQLVALARAGDEQAFAAIVERYRVPLLRYCNGFLPAAAAEDALQQTFINAYPALTRGTASAPVALRPWLYRVAHNAALNVARDPQAGLEQLPERLDGVRRPDEVVQQRERLRRVVGAVAALPPKQRQVIVRHALDGESHERIASDLGMSPGSIRQLAHRARRTVREAAAALLPTPILRLLPLGTDAAEVAPAAGGGAVLVKLAVAAVVAGAAGGGAVEAVRHGGEARAVEVAQADARHPEVRPRLVEPGRLGQLPAHDPLGSPTEGSGFGQSGSGARRSGGDSGGSGSSGSGSDASGSGSGSSGSGSSGSGGDSSGSSGSESSGSSGSGSSGSGGDSSGSGGGSSGSGSSGSGGDSSGSGSGSSGSGSSGSGGDSSGSSGSGSSGSGGDSSGSSGSGSSGSGDLSTSGSSGSGSSGSGELSTSGSSGSGSSDSGSSGSGSGEELSAGGDSSGSSGSGD